MTCGSQEGYPRDSDVQRKGEIRKPCQSCCQIFESFAGSRFLYYQSEDLNGIFLKDFSLLSVSCFAVLFHKPLAIQSAVLAAQILALASRCTCVLPVSPSSDKCPWPLRNSINPDQSFPLCECTVSLHVCCRWHAEQQGLLASN